MFKGERIKELLAESRITKKKLAEATGLTKIGLGRRYCRVKC